MRIKKLGIVLIALFAISAANFNQDKLYEISKNIEIFINVYKELNSNYVDDLDPNQLMRVGIDAMVSSLDPYTNYISESQVASYMITTEGKYEGIGAVVEKVDDYLTIIEPYEGSPVLEAGLKAGDQIIAIEGQSTKGKSKEELTAYYRGVPGTKLRLKIRTHEGLEKDIDLTRMEVNIPNVPYYGMVSDDIAYISLTTFTQNASKNIRKAISELRNDNPGIKGIILDLRNNGGGLLREAIGVSNIFVDKDLEVVSVKSKVKERDLSYRTMEQALDTEIPLVVMINKRSASASEIVSGVIQDLDRGVLIGQRSFGKGLVQNTKEVGYNSRVKLTTSKYYIPSGRCIQSVKYDNGEPVDIPDDKRSQFKTSKGRTVLDGGGVTPDVRLKLEEDSEVLKALKEQYLIFKYANDYIVNLDSSMINNEINFQDFENFKAFVAQNDFSYETRSQKHLKELESELKRSDDPSYNSNLQAINSIIESEKSKALDRSRDAIIDEIEIELATRLNFQEAKAFQKLKNDSEIFTAIELLHDQDRYNEILNKTDN